MAAADRQDTGYARLRHRAATLALTIAAALALPALASPRVLLYAAGDTQQLRAAQRGVREALGSTPIVEIPADDGGERLKTAAREDPGAAIIALGPEAALRAARDAPALATIDCMSTQAGAGAKAVPAAIPFEQQSAWLKRLLPGARYIGVLYDPAQNSELVGALAAALRAADLNPVLAPVATPAMLPPALARLSTSADVLLAALVEIGQVALGHVGAHVTTHPEHGQHRDDAEGDDLVGPRHPRGHRQKADKHGR